MNAGLVAQKFLRTWCPAPLAAPGQPPQHIIDEIPLYGQRRVTPVNERNILMLKFPLLRSKLENAATLLLTATLLAFSLPGSHALAAGEAQEQAQAANAGTSPATETPSAGNQSAGGAAPAPSVTPAAEGPVAPEARPAEPRPDGTAEVGKSAAPAHAGTKPAPKLADPKPRDLTPKPENAQAPVRPSTVNALYNISFLGSQIGEFKVRSTINARQYSLQATADLSALFGIVSWKGVTNSHGLMTPAGPVPQNYHFRYATSDKSEAVEIRFQDRMVQDIIINPPSRPGARAVPITAEDLQNVVDPLSALILLTQARPSRFSAAEACNRRLPVFDGRIRYDLVLSPKGTRPIESVGRLHGNAYVCRVSYVPIAGHKAGKTDYAAGNSGIEIWLVPMPEAGLLVPYYVHVPTPAGTASMITARFDVDTSAGRHALAD